jgi:hypothetical protein
MWMDSTASRIAAPSLGIACVEVIFPYMEAQASVISEGSRVPMLRPAVATLVLVCGARGDGEWMWNWLKSADERSNREYDVAVTEDFIRHSSAEHSSVFSPMCSEINVLLQALGGEYEGVGRRHMRRVERMMCNDKEGLRVSNRAYIPEGEYSGLESVGVLKRYDPKDASECERLLEEDKKWAGKETRGRIQSALRMEDLVRSSRIYSSIAYFKDRWYFDKKSEEGNFYVRRGKKIKRSFMDMGASSRLYSHSCMDLQRGFLLAAVPYTGGGKGRRSVIYLIPKAGGPETGAEADLTKMWEEFSVLVNRCGVAGLLEARCKESEIRLRVPKIRSLETGVYLTEILRRTYGCGPLGPCMRGRLVRSKMVSRIDVGGSTETASHVSSPDRVVDWVSADRPYILFMYDGATDRILFVVKDVGRINKGD